jgi:hypothetical protein
MKNLSIIFIAVSFCLCTVKGFSQKEHSGKPLMFSNYPPIINCTEDQLNNIFSYGLGDHVNIALPANLTLSGPVTSNIVKFSNLQTVVIKLPSFNNILFALSKRLDENNKPVYVGHLFNKDYADGYELRRTNGGNYQFVKIETEKLLPTCNQQN